jgi:hypothetical protein
MKNSNFEKIQELTPEEYYTIIGGGPNKNTSFFYDISYTIVHGIGDGYQYLSGEGVFTLGWWEDWALDTF